MIAEHLSQAVCDSEHQKGEARIDHEHPWNPLGAETLEKRGVNIVAKDGQSEKDGKEYCSYPKEAGKLMNVNFQVFFNKLFVIVHREVQTSEGAGSPSR